MGARPTSKALRWGSVGAAAAIIVAIGLLLALRNDETAPVVGPDATAAPTLDLRTDVGSNAPFLASFDAGALGRGAGIDQIRAIDRPVFDSTPVAAAHLRDTDLVYVVEIGGDAHAYPEKLLSVHEVVNDSVGGTPVALVWCPLCRTATAFERTVNGETRLFGVSGLLYHRNVILFDRETGSLWSQLLGGAVTGTMRGTSLGRVPVVQMTFARWRERHPGGTVLSIAGDSESDLFTDPFENGTTFGPESSDLPYTSYWAKVPTFYRRVVDGLEDSALVVGLVVGDESRAYPLGRVTRARVVEDEVGGLPVLLAVGDSEALWASAFSREVDGRVLDFVLLGDLLTDSQSGTSWSLDGRALRGPLAGKRLQLLPATTSYWFAWRSLYPRSRVWPGT